MMNQQTLQNIIYRDDPIQYFSSPSTIIEEIDRMNLMDNLISVFMRKPPIKFRSLFSLIEIVLSTYRSRLEIKS